MDLKTTEMSMRTMQAYANTMSKQMAKLSEENALDFLMGLVKSGDLVRHISDDNGKHTEGWSYIPYRGILNLKSENEQLKMKLDSIKIIANS